LPFPVEAESRTVEAEAMSLGGSIVSQIFGFVRMIAERVIAIVRQIMTWIGEHPMASIMFFVNVLIWFSP
jgi:predicted nuclease with RNAse H fold